MNRLYLRLFSIGATMLSLAACSQEDLYPSAESGNAVRIGSVSIGSKVETRVSENPDDGGKSSLWDFDGTEQIAVQVKDGVQGVYTLNEDKSVTSTQPTYWTGSGTQTINAWYPVECGNIDLSNQSAGHLAYALFATATGTYPYAVALKFSHSLAKLRVRLKGDVELIEKIVARHFTSCSLNTANGTVTGNGEGYIPLSQATYSTTDGLVTYWEANVAPGAVANDVLRFNDSFNAGIASVTEFEAGKIYTVTYTVMSSNIVTFEGYTIEEWKKEQVPSGTTDISKLDYFIDDDGTYLVYTEAGLWAWAARVSSGGNATNCKLMADIDLSYTDITTANWEPVGTEENPYTGTFDGNGHSLGHLIIVQKGKTNVGFIGYLNGGTVKNLTVLDGSWVYGAKNVGSVVGTNKNGMVINCYSSCEVEGWTATDYKPQNAVVGGIVGYNWADNGNAYVIACQTGEDGCARYGINGSYVGGVVGMSSATNQGDATVIACGIGGQYVFVQLTNTNPITANGYCGGVVGYIHAGAGSNSSVIACYSVGNVANEFSWQVAGWLAGLMRNENTDESAGTALLKASFGTYALDLGSRTDVLVGEQNNGMVTDCLQTNGAYDPSQAGNDATSIANAAIKEWNTENNNLCPYRYVARTDTWPLLSPGMP